MDHFPKIFTRKIAHKSSLNPYDDYTHNPNDKVTTKLPFGNILGQNCFTFCCICHDVKIGSLEM